jgi:tRNA/rRNA methyltransferase
VNGNNLLARIKIVLVEPAGALNIGSIARVMKNMGLEQLVLVNPQCDCHGKEARQMAVHAGDLLDKAIVVDGLPTALVGCQRAIATTARSRTIPTQLESPEIALPWLLVPQIDTALIFGPEDRGLSNSELSHAQKFVTIPSHPAYPSLNLAQAVAVCSYELYRTALEKNHNIDNRENHVTVLEEKSRKNSDLEPLLRTNAPLDLLEAYYQHLEATLLEIGYLYPHTAGARMDKFRRLYHRANLTVEEVAMLRGILRQIQWAIKHKQSTNG